MEKCTVNDRREKKVKRLRDRLHPVDFDAAYSSPLGRARNTANILLENKDTSLSLEEGLKEISFGQWEGKTVEEVQKQYPKKCAMFWNNPTQYQPVSGESIYDVQERVLASLDTILEKHPHSTVLIVSHGCALKLILAHFEGRSLAKLWDPPKLQPASLSKVKVNDHRAKVLLYADTTHYPPR